MVKSRPKSELSQTCLPSAGPSIGRQPYLPFGSGELDVGFRSCELTVLWRLRSRAAALGDAPGGGPWTWLIRRGPSSVARRTGRSLPVSFPRSRSTLRSCGAVGWSPTRKSGTRNVYRLDPTGMRTCGPGWTASGRKREALPTVRRDIPGPPRELDRRSPKDSSSPGLLRWPGCVAPST